jgi:hypothetical protein
LTLQNNATFFGDNVAINAIFNDAGIISLAFNFEYTDSANLFTFDGSLQYSQQCTAGVQVKVINIFFLLYKLTGN